MSVVANAQDGSLLLAPPVPPKQKAPLCLENSSFIYRKLPPEAEQRRKAFDLIKQVLAAHGELSAEDQKRVNEVGRLFGVEEDGSAGLTPFRQPRREPQARAS